MEAARAPGRGRGGPGRLEAGRARGGRAASVIVGLGGSASTDGGLGCLEALEPLSRLAGVELVIATDVATTFVEAASVFSPQKGASPAEVLLLERRLAKLARDYERRFGTDVTAVPGSGAAGGLGGALIAAGGRIEQGFAVVAGMIGLEARIVGAGAVVTGEGLLDATSFEGKVVGGVTEIAGRAGVPTLVVAGDATEEGRDLLASRRPGTELRTLVELFGPERASQDTSRCVTEAVTAWLAR
ncbi:MAG: glycerate kinase [Acidimicrobiales bacterium]